MPLFLSCFLADRRPTPLFLNRYVSMKSDFTFTLPLTPLRPAALQGQGRRQVQFLHLLDCYEVDERGHLQALPPVQHLRPGPRVGAPRRDPLRVCSSRFLKGLAAGTPRLKWAKPRAMFLNGGSVFFNAQARLYDEICVVELGRFGHPKGQRASPSAVSANV